MALNYSFSPGTLPLADRTAVFGTGTTPRNISTCLNGTDLYIAIANDGGNNIHLHKLTAASFSGTIAASSRLATFTTGSSPRWVKVFVDGTTLYIASADYNSNLISFFRTDLNASSTTLTASFATPNRPYGLDFYISGTTGYLVSFNDTSGNCSFFRFDPTTVSGTSIAANATLTAGSGVRSGRLVHSGGTVYIVVANSTSGTSSFFRLTTPGSVTGTVAATATLTSSSGSQDVCMVLDGSTTAYIANAVYNNSTTYFYRLNPTTVSGTVASTATFTNGRGPNSANINLLSSTSAILTIASFDADTVTQYFFNPSTLATTVSTTSRLYATGTPVYYSELIISGSTAYLISVERTSQTASFWRGGLNSVGAALATTSPQKISSSSPIQKVSGGVLTLSSSIDYFIAYLLFSLGSQLTASGISTTVYGWSFSATSDTEGTLNEDFIYSGATAEITGNYRLTMGASRTLTLASKGTYTDSITIPSTGTLVITANTTVTSEFILSAGATVNKSGAGPYTLTIPYQDPGLVLGSGVVLSAPAITFSAANINDNGFDNVRCRTSWYDRISFTTTEVNTGTNKITLSGISGKVSQNTVIRLAGTDLPAPLEADQVFYPYSISGNSISLSSTPGGAGSEIDLTDVGSGSMVAIVVTELNTQLVTSGGYSFNLNTASASTGITLDSGDTLLFQAIHWKGSLQSVDPAVASKYHEEFLQYSGGNVSTLADLEAYNEHDTFAIQQSTDGYEISQLTVTGSTPTRYQWRVDASAPGRVQIESEDPDRVISTTWAVLYFQYMQWTIAGLRLFRGQIEAENLNSVVIQSPEPGIDADLTVESFPAGIPLLVNGPGMYRSDGKTWIATGSPIQHQPDALVAVPIEVEVPVNLSSEVMQMFHSIAAGVAIAANNSGGGLDAAGIRSAIGLASANLDTQLDAIPTVTELNARTLPSANYFDPASDPVTIGAISNNAITAASIATDAIDSDAIAASAVTEIQSGLATSSVVNAIKSQTDKFTFTGSTVTFPSDFSALTRVQKLVENNHKIDETANTLTIFDDNGTTPFIVYDLKDKDGNPAYEKVFERRKQ